MIHRNINARSLSHRLFLLEWKIEVISKNSRILKKFCLQFFTTYFAMGIFDEAINANKSQGFQEQLKTLSLTGTPPAKGRQPTRIKSLSG